MGSPTISACLVVYNEEKLMGNFAHELCHLEDYQNNSLKYYLLYAIQGLSKKWRGNYEKQIDRCTIKKGYGKELYEQRSSRYKDKDKNSEKFKPLFLSPKEIKQYAKKINKW